MNGKIGTRARRGMSWWALAALLMASFPLARAADAVKLPAGVQRPPFFDIQGIRVLGYEKGPSGLNVWRVEKNATQTVFYTTADNKTLISGVAWDAKTGQNLSDKYIAAEVAAQPMAAAQQYSPDRTPEQIVGISKLDGVLDTAAGKNMPQPVDRILYIMFDPRCPHCHAAYVKTRDYVTKQGGWIKWIPVTVLGNPEQGAGLVAAIMQAGNASDQRAAMALAVQNKLKPVAPNAQTRKLIADNEAYFWAAFDGNKSAGTPGVPVAFFVTSQGVPQMVGGIDDDLLLQQIIAGIKK